MSIWKNLKNDIMIYDTALKTGNRALDIVLMEKALFCKNHDICWTCMADGEHLDFMRVEDIYAIFGNALDNAITAVMKVTDPDKRVVSTKLIIQSDLMVIQVQNYYEGKLQFEKGLPLTTKKNKADHGYGMKSIRYTAEKIQWNYYCSDKESDFYVTNLDSGAELCMSQMRHGRL